MLIEIKVAHGDGAVVFLPAGDVALALARLCKTQELHPSFLGQAAKWLDAEVIVVSGNCEAAAEALAAHLEPVLIH